MRAKVCTTMPTLRQNEAKIITFFFAFAFLVCCERIPSEYQDFFNLGIGEQEKSIHNYPLDHQIDLMILGFEYLIPPSHFLAREVAKNGKIIIPLLMQRLRTIDSEHAKNAVLYALLEIDLRHYEWRKDPEYITLLKEEAAAMQNSSWRQETLEMVKTLN